MSKLQREIDNSHRGILHWNYRNFGEIPQVVLNYDQGTAIRDLYLKENQIQSLPEDWKGLKGTLEQLHLAENRIKSVNEESLSEFKYLKELDLSSNSISSFDYSKLCNLTHLNLSKNGLNNRLCESIGN